MIDKHTQEDLGMLLKRSGLSNSKGYMSVMTYALECGGHFLKSDIKGERAKQKLKDLVELGFLKRTIIDNKNSKISIQYESTYRKQEHFHIICTECSNVQEVDATIIRDQAKIISETLNFEMHDYMYQISGRCSNCTGR